MKPLTSIASINAGVAKEAFGVFDPMDIIATVAGGCLPLDV